MKSRVVNYTAIIFAAWVVAFVVLLMMAADTRAGEIEHRVITESWTSFIESPEAETGTEVQPFLDDMNDIQGDTTQGSYCETLASSYAFYIGTYRDVLDMTEYDPETYAAMIVATEVVLPEMPAIATRCLEE